MRIVVDTNISFSGLLNPNGRISDLLLNSSDSFQFFAPSFIIDELEDHHKKLIKISQLSKEEIEVLKRILFRKIELIDVENIPAESWKKAVDLDYDIDEQDAPFIALSLALKCPLWTGDKNLMGGLKKKNFSLIFDTDSISKIRD